MPTACAASTRPVPFGTETWRSSTVTATSSDTSGLRPVVLVHRARREDSLERGLPVERATTEVDVCLVLVAEAVDVAQDGDRVRVAERAEALAHDPVADGEEQVEVGLQASPVLDLLEYLRHPARADTARGALAALLVLVELRHADAELHHAAAVVDDDHARRADRGSCLDEGREVHLHVDVVGGQDRGRGAAGDDQIGRAAWRERGTVEG